MALLNRLLRLLEWIEALVADLADFVDWLTAPWALALVVGLIGVPLVNGGATLTAALLASVTAWALHCVLSEPEA